MNMDCRRGRPRSRTTGMIFGAGAILLGGILLLEQVPGLPWAPALQFLKHLWPLILVAVGATRILEGRRPGPGWLLVAAGLVLLARTLGHLRIAALAWPAILLCAGICLVVRSLRRPRQDGQDGQGPGPWRGGFADPGPGPSPDHLKASAILSGFKHAVRSQAFRGGELSAIFGGFELDLREAQLAGGSAQLDLFLLFGGGEIRVPADWEVTTPAAAVAGGVSDRHAPGPGGPGGRPRLELTGQILFGGCEIRR